jgi:hypothetical protein
MEKDMMQQLPRRDVPSQVDFMHKFIDGLNDIHAAYKEAIDAAESGDADTPIPANYTEAYSAALRRHNRTKASGLGHTYSRQGDALGGDFTVMAALAEQKGKAGKAAQQLLAALGLKKPPSGKSGKPATHKPGGGGGSGGSGVIGGDGKKAPYCQWCKKDGHWMYHSKATETGGCTDFYKHKPAYDALKLDKKQIIALKLPTA